MDVMLSGMTWVALGFLLGLVLGYLANAGYRRTIAVVVVVATVLVYWSASPWQHVLIGAAVGLILFFRGRALAIAALVAAAVYFGGYPWLMNLRSVQGISMEGIHNEALAYADAARKALDRQNKPVVDSAKAGELNIGQQGAALRNRGRIGYQQVINEQMAMLELKGVTFGDLAIPANHVPSNLPGTERVDPETLYYTGKSACGQTTLVAWGKLNSSLTNSTLNRWVDVRGWIDASGRGQKPKDWLDHPLIEERAPYVALLVYNGKHSRPRWDWEPIGDDKYRMVIDNGDRCEMLYAAANDMIVDNAGLSRPGFFADNRGSQQTDPQNSNGGVQVQIVK